MNDGANPLSNELVTLLVALVNILGAILVAWLRSKAAKPSKEEGTDKNA